MPEAWIGDLVRDVYMNGLTMKQLAKEAGYNDKYVSQVLHSEAPSERAKKRLLDALERLSGKEG